MTFAGLDVGDRFTVNIPNVTTTGTLEKILPEFSSCCHMDANAINLDTGIKFVCPSFTEVTKL